jgi:hypothetical protein
LTNHYFRLLLRFLVNRLDRGRLRGERDLLVLHAHPATAAAHVLPRHAVVHLFNLKVLRRVAHFTVAAADAKGVVEHSEHLFLFSLHVVAVVGGDGQFPAVVGGGGRRNWLSAAAAVFGAAAVHVVAAVEDIVAVVGFVILRVAETDCGNLSLPYMTSSFCGFAGWVCNDSFHHMVFLSGQTCRVWRELTCRGVSGLPHTRKSYSLISPPEYSPTNICFSQTSGNRLSITLRLWLILVLESITVFAICSFPFIFAHITTFKAKDGRKDARTERRICIIYNGIQCVIKTKLLAVGIEVVVHAAWYSGRGGRDE